MKVLFFFVLYFSFPHDSTSLSSLFSRVFLNAYCFIFLPLVLVLFISYSSIFLSCFSAVFLIHRFHISLFALFCDILSLLLPISLHPSRSLSLSVSVCLCLSVSVCLCLSVCLSSWSLFPLESYDKVDTSLWVLWL